MNASTLYIWLMLFGFGTLIWIAVLPWIGEQDWMYQLIWRMG